MVDGGAQVLQPRHAESGGGCGGPAISGRRSIVRKSSSGSQIQCPPASRSGAPPCRTGGSREPGKRLRKPRSAADCDPTETVASGRGLQACGEREVARAPDKLAESVVSRSSENGPSRHHPRSPPTRALRPHSSRASDENSFISVQNVRADSSVRLSTLVRPWSWPEDYIRVSCGSPD